MSYAKIQVMSKLDCWGKVRVSQKTYIFVQSYLGYGLEKCSAQSSEREVQ